VSKRSYDRLKPRADMRVHHEEGQSPPCDSSIRLEKVMAPAGRL
jgi:hypothetical protein